MTLSTVAPRRGRGQAPRERNAAAPRERFQQAIDTRALELASQAIGRLDDHQQECRDRYLAQDAKLDLVGSRLESLRTTIVTTVIGGAGSIILALGGAVITLIINHH